MAYQKVKNIIAILLCFTIAFASIPCQAATLKETYVVDGKTYTVKITESSNSKTIRVEGEEDTSIISMDKNSKIIKMNTIDKKGNTILNKNTNFTINSDSSAIPSKTAIAQSLSTPQLIAQGGDYIWGQGYSIVVDFNTMWYITSGGSFKERSENSTNYSQLLGFKDAVDSAACNFVIAGGMTGFAIVSAVAGAIAAAGSVTVSLIIGLLLAAGGLVAAAGYILASYICSQDANYHFQML